MAKLKITVTVAALGLTSGTVEVALAHQDSRGDWTWNPGLSLSPESPDRTCIQRLLKLSD